MNNITEYYTGFIINCNDKNEMETLYTILNKTNLKEIFNDVENFNVMIENYKKLILELTDLTILNITIKSPLYTKEKEPMQYFTFLKELIDKEIEFRKNPEKGMLEYVHSNDGQADTPILIISTMLNELINNTYENEEAIKTVINKNFQTYKNIIMFESFILIYRNFNEFKKFTDTYTDEDLNNLTDLLTICNENIKSQIKKFEDNTLLYYKSVGILSTIPKLHNVFLFTLYIKTFIYIISTFYKIKKYKDYLNKIENIDSKQIILVDLMNVRIKIITIYTELLKDFILQFDAKFKEIIEYNITEIINDEYIISKIQTNIIDKIFIFFTKNVKETKPLLATPIKSNLTTNKRTYYKRGGIELNTNTPKLPYKLWSNARFKESNEIDDYSLLYTYHYYKNLKVPPGNVKILSGDHYKFYFEFKNDKKHNYSESHVLFNNINIFIEEIKFNEIISKLYEDSKYIEKKYKIKTADIKSKWDLVKTNVTQFYREMITMIHGKVEPTKLIDVNDSDKSFLFPNYIIKKATRRKTTLGLQNRSNSRSSNSTTLGLQSRSNSRSNSSSNNWRKRSIARSSINLRQNPITKKVSLNSRNTLGRPYNSSSKSLFQRVKKSSKLNSNWRSRNRPSLPLPV